VADVVGLRLTLQILPLDDRRQHDSAADSLYFFVLFEQSSFSFGSAGSACAAFPRRRCPSGPDSIFAPAPVAATPLAVGFRRAVFPQARFSFALDRATKDELMPVR
jgi:hypothetical protein